MCEGGKLTCLYTIPPPCRTPTQIQSLSRLYSWLNKHRFKICSKIKSRRASRRAPNSLHGSRRSSICLMRNSRRYQTQRVCWHSLSSTHAFLTFHTCWSHKMISDALSAAFSRPAMENMLSFEFPARKKKKKERHSHLSMWCVSVVWKRRFCTWSSSCGILISGFTSILLL